MSDILLIALLITGPAALIVSWLAFLNSSIGMNASDLDERELLSPRPDLTRSLAGAFPR
jgi:hypothetical protein